LALCCCNCGQQNQTGEQEKQDTTRIPLHGTTSIDRMADTAVCVGTNAVD